MKQKINLLIFFEIFLQIQQIIPLNVKRSSSYVDGILQPKVDCCLYANDHHLVEQFPFHMNFNPFIKSSLISYAIVDKDDHIIHMKIVNQEYIPKLIYCLKHLSKLELINTKISDSEEKLSSDIQYFAPTLTYLSIANTTVSYLTNEITKLKHLEALKLSNTGLKSLPDAITNLTSLKTLYLPNNHLTSLPSTIINLHSLEQLTLFNNSDLHTIDSLNGHPHLKFLDTRHCPIEMLPRNLPHLSSLFMTNNKLTKLTDIETLGYETDHNKYFYFSKNHIRLVPPKIQSVRNLARLNLYQNELDYLPTDIFNIPTLSYLNIQKNQFQPRNLQTIISKFQKTNPKLHIKY